MDSSRARLVSRAGHLSKPVRSLCAAGAAKETSRLLEVIETSFLSKPKTAPSQQATTVSAIRAQTFRLRVQGNAQICNPIDFVYRMKQTLLLFLFILGGLASLPAQNCDLHKAILANEPSQVQACIEANADLEARDAKGRSALLLAVSAEGGTVPERQKKIVTALLLAGAQRNAVDDKGNGALHFAAFQGTYDLVALLLAQGADPELKNQNEETPLLMAARGPLLDDGRLKTFELLLVAKANVRQADTAGRTALHLLCAHKPRLESPQAADEMILYLAQQLEKGGAALKAEDNAKRTPFSNAMQQGHAQTALWLLDKGASAIPAVLADFTALHIATERNQWPLIERLLKAGIDINRTTMVKRQAEDQAYFYPKGSTPLDLVRIAEHESKDPNVQKELKALAANLKQHGAISKTYDEYVKGFSVMKGANKTSGGSKISR
jgi:ankyrin repeat protein